MGEIMRANMRQNMRIYKVWQTLLNAIPTIRDSTMVGSLYQ